MVVLLCVAFSAFLRNECMLGCCSRVWLFVTPWTVARQAPLFMEFSRQEYCSGLPLPPPGDLSNPEIEPTSLKPPALAGGFITTSATWEGIVDKTVRHLKCPWWLDTHTHTHTHTLWKDSPTEFINTAVTSHIYHSCVHENIYILLSYQVSIIQCSVVLYSPYYALDPQSLLILELKVWTFLPNPLFPPPSIWQRLFYSVSMSSTCFLLLFKISHWSDTMQYLSFSVQFISFSIMPSLFIHVVAGFPSV